MPLLGARRGGASGWVGGLGALGGFVVPPLLGGMVEWLGSIGYARGYAVFVALAVVSLALTGVLRAARRQPSSTTVHQSM